MALGSPAPRNSADEIASVARLDTADKLARKFDTLKRGREHYTRQWKLNLAFYKGRQYTFVDRLGRISSLPTEDAEKPRHRVRLVANQIVSGSHSLLSKYTKTKPVMTASPGSSSDHDVKAAQMAEDLMEYWWHDLQLEDALEEALLWGIIAGQGYWKITWDEHAGKAMRFMLGPDGRPITDESKQEQWRGKLAEMGQEPQEQTAYLGDIRVEAMSPFDVYLDPSAKTFKDCKYAICVHHMDPDEVYARWKKRVKADSVSSEPDTALPFNNAENAADKTTKRIFVGYFIPSAALPKGRYVVWAENPNEILYDGPWPYQTNELPLVKFPGLRVPGSIYDSSIVEHAVPLQKEFNYLISKIAEYTKLTVTPRVWAPVGSLRNRITNEPGAVYEFTPIAGLRPEVERLQAIPPYVFEYLNTIQTRLRDVFALTEVTEGQVPPNVEAGVAIDLLQEMSTDRLAPTIKLIEHAIARSGQLMLSLAQHYYIEPRLLKIRGSGGSVQVRRFTQADIDGGVSISVEAGSGLPRTRAGRQARIQSYVEMGVLKPDQAWKYLDIGDMKSVAKMFQADEDKAYREHEKLIRGIPLNPLAAQQAIMQVQMGMNPETGMAFQDEQEIMTFVERASMQPTAFENSAVDLDVHGLFMKSVEFENLDPQVQQRFITHYSLTLEKLQSQQPMPQPEPVKTSLQLKGTIGPTGAAEILRTSGNPGITPEVMAEPPLETWVTDSMDKPDVDSAGNDPLTPDEQAGVELALAAKEDALLENKLREQSAKADLAEKKRDQSDFRPKNNG
jgi:hypothetical protein